MTNATRALRVGIVVPHIFMQDILQSSVIFSPGTLARDLARGLVASGTDVVLYTPGPVVVSGVPNSTADMRLFEQELTGRGYGYVDLLKKHPMTFIAMARQVQAEIIAKAFADANAGRLDVVHIYTNEEDIALPFAQFCTRPVVFTHHDPFSLLVQYKNNFPKYAQLNWISLSMAQRASMPPETHWVGNIYHGLPRDEYSYSELATATDPYVVYLGRIVESKGVHLAVGAVREYNRRATGPRLRLKIAGKHYAGHAKDTYWNDTIVPHIDGVEVEYVGFIKSAADKQALLGGAQALIMPSIFEEPFGMVAIESMACGTPVIGLNRGAIAEVIGEDGGLVVEAPMSTTAGRSHIDEQQVVGLLAEATARIPELSRKGCRQRFERKFTLDTMVAAHHEVYRQLAG